MRCNLLCLRLPVARVKLLFLDKLHDHLYYMLVRQESKQLAGEATVPDFVVSRCSFCFKTALAFLFVPQRSSMFWVSKFV